MRGPGRWSRVLCLVAACASSQPEPLEPARVDGRLTPSAQVRLDEPVVEIAVWQDDLWVLSREGDRRRLWWASSRVGEMQLVAVFDQPIGDLQANWRGAWARSERGVIRVGRDRRVRRILGDYVALCVSPRGTTAVDRAGTSWVLPGVPRAVSEAPACLGRHGFGEVDVAGPLRALTSDGSMSWAVDPHGLVACEGTCRRVAVEPEGVIRGRSGRLVWGVTDGIVLLERERLVRFSVHGRITPPVLSERGLWWADAEGTVWRMPLGERHASSQR